MAVKIEAELERCLVMVWEFSTKVDATWLFCFEPRVKTRVLLLLLLLRSF